MFAKIIKIIREKFKKTSPLVVDHIDKRTCKHDYQFFTRNMTHTVYFCSICGREKKF